ncbi:hypothetical protein [Novosphingobium sp. P6W]|uniref:hypothetical protein n=1 Tax=Novosphingobium sp. P6W TaxID=1609758 RepID=UPI0013B41405|nr:hypothetical protein [Novosphingobium sp. P6W]
MFVAFLTALFVIVTYMLQPGDGVVAARMLDNVVGSLAAVNGGAKVGHGAE